MLHVPHNALHTSKRGADFVVYATHADEEGEDADPKMVQAASAIRNDFFDLNRHDAGLDAVDAPF